MRVCAGCGVSITALDGTRCRSCRSQRTRNTIRKVGPQGTPGAATFAKRDKLEEWRNAPTKGWS